MQTSRDSSLNNRHARLDLNQHLRAILGKALKKRERERQREKERERERERGGREGGRRRDERHHFHTCKWII